jgi:hypothetical protein
VVVERACGDAIEQPGLDELAQLRAGPLVADGTAQHRHERLRILSGPLPHGEIGADHAFAEVFGSYAHLGPRFPKGNGNERGSERI